ncbi:alpha/beta fold hydrolase [Streptomyces sp. NPDC002825]|uniref:thioesterase II family protein n=1 Tax=Streptomyces sp. NPDC002825 TaxID=3154666 RepID=UPI0033273957
MTTSTTPVPLLCLPPAGGGPSFFASWAGADPALDVVALPLPGKEALFIDEPAETVADLVEAVLPSVHEAVEGKDRVALFGHCFGAVVAYALAERLATTRPGLGLVLFASGSAAPGVLLWEQATGLPDDAFVEAVERNAGLRNPALGDPDLRELLLPVLRADVAAQESYAPVDKPSGTYRIVTVRGEQDELVGAADSARWAEFAGEPPRAFELPGGHMYLLEQRDPLLEIVRHELDSSA